MSTMPPSASLTLPPVTMSGEYIMEDHESHSDQGWAPDDFPAKQGNYLQGNYLRCVAEVRGFWCVPGQLATDRLREQPLLIFKFSPLMCRSVHSSTTWPQTCSTTWSSCKRSSWRRSMRSSRRSQVLFPKTHTHLHCISCKTLIDVIAQHGQRWDKGIMETL